MPTPPRAHIPPACPQGPPRCGSEGRDPARVRRELPRLWRAQGLAAIAAGRLLRRALYGGPADGEHGPSGGGPGQALPDNDNDKAAPCPLDHVNRQFHVGAGSALARGFYLRLDMGLASSMSPSSSTPMLDGSSAGEPAGRRTPTSFSLRPAQFGWVAPRDSHSGSDDKSDGGRSESSAMVLLLSPLPEKRPCR